MRNQLVPGVPIDLPNSQEKLLRRLDKEPLMAAVSPVYPPRSPTDSPLWKTLVSEALKSWMLGFSKMRRVVGNRPWFLHLLIRNLSKFDTRLIKTYNLN